MADVRVTVNEQVYQITCGEGEEDRVTALAQYLDGHIQHLTSNIGHIAESRLLMLAGLTVCDELFAAREQLSAGRPQPDPALELLLHDAAERIERLTTALQTEDAQGENPAS
ncbi:MAG: cell division protein ZapA [Pseudomonadota bacterium]